MAGKGILQIILATKGIVWVVLGSIVALGIIGFAFLGALTRDQWCNGELNAGDCEAYDLYWNCFCIDEGSAKHEDQELGLYENAQALCQNSNGTLATPDEDELLIWLSKRLFFSGIDQAFIGLRKIGSKWYWMKRTKSEPVTKSFVWRSEFPPNIEDTYAIITVETAKKQPHGVPQNSVCACFVAHNTEDQGKDTDDYTNYIYYNYDHYAENDNNYGWYGITTSNNEDNRLRGVYHICHYVSKPTISERVATQAPSTTEINMESDPCFCKNEEHIELKERDESQTFTSPRYPVNYCSDANCRWIIRTPADLVVRVEWLVFNIEKGMDYVLVYDGETDAKDSERLDQCTGSTCTTQLSSGPAMQVHFKSDHVITELGFKARVTATNPDPCYCASLSSVTMANLGETYTLQSPNYPSSYCPNHKCGWVVTAPIGLGLQITWLKFKILSDQLSVYDGISADDRELIKCSRESCGNVISAGAALYVHFISGDVNAELGGSFSALITVVQNYCKMDQTGNKEQLETLGTISYSEIRQDGHIPAGFTAMLTCDHNDKIKGSIDTIVDTITCISPDWERELVPCTEVCPIDKPLSEDVQYNNMHMCEWNSGQVTTLVNDGHSLVMTLYDYLNDVQVAEPITYNCEGTVWEPETPICDLTVCQSFPLTSHMSASYSRNFSDSTNETAEHVTLTCEGLTNLYVNGIRHYGSIVVNCIESNWEITDIECGGYILTFGGFNHHTIFHHVQSFYPEEPARNEIYTCTDIPEEVCKGIYSIVDIAAPLGDKVLLMGGEQRSDFLQKTVIYDPFTKTFDETSPNFPTRRYDFAAAILNDILYVCGGKFAEVLMSTFPSCIKFTSDGWVTAKPMKIARDQHAMASLNGKIIATGGMGIAGPELSAEYYDPNTNSWTELGPLPVHIQFHGSAVAQGHLYVCGGIQDFDESSDCYKYDEMLDSWAKVSSMYESHPQLLELGGRLVSFGSKYLPKTMEVYDPITNIWSLHPTHFIRPTYRAASVVLK